MSRPPIRRGMLQAEEFLKKLEKVASQFPRALADFLAGSPKVV